MNFTLHTEPNASVPEFTISCRTHGGPATTVVWRLNDTKLHNNHSYSFINDTTTSTYDHMLRMSGRENIGNYNCSIWNNIRYYWPSAHPQVNDSINVTGKKTLHSVHQNYYLSIQLQESPPISLQSSLRPTVHMWISLCLGSHQVILPLMAMSSTTSLREDQSSMTGCLEERQTHTHWMVFREESPTASH